MIGTEAKLAGKILNAKRSKESTAPFPVDQYIKWGEWVRENRINKKGESNG